MSYTKLLPLFCAVIISTFLSAFADPTPPATTIKPKLKVNVLANVSVTDEEIKAMVKKANETLKQAGISYDLDPNISRGVSDGGNNDGKLTQAELRKLDRAGQKEADRLYGKGKGVKVYISNEILGDPETMGYAGHVKKNRRGRLIGKRVIHIKKDSDPNYVPDMGPTLAHESGHLFTLGDRGPVDVNNGKYSDANGHTTEPNNFMNEIIDPCNNVITPDQAKEMKEGAKRMCACVKNVQLPDSVSGCTLTERPQIVFGWTDDIDDTALEYIDLDTGSMYLEDITANLEFSILLNGMFPATPVDGVSYKIYMDMDENPSTGYTGGSIYGAEKIITLELLGTHPEGTVIATIEDTVEMTIVALPFASTGSIKGLADYRGKEPTAEVYCDGLYVEIPMELLSETYQTYNIISVWITAEDLGSGQTDEIMFYWDNPPAPLPETTITLASTKIEPFEPIEISGSNFFPGEEITITLDDEPIGTVIPDGVGNFSDIFYFAPGSDPFDGGVNLSPWNFVNAKNLSGQNCYSVMQLVPNKADLNADTKVNFLDLAIMGQNWLHGTEGLIVP